MQIDHIKSIHVHTDTGRVEVKQWKPPWYTGNLPTIVRRFDSVFVRWIDKSKKSHFIPLEELVSSGERYLVETTILGISIKKTLGPNDYYSFNSLSDESKMNVELYNGQLFINLNDFTIPKFKVPRRRMNP